MLNPVVKTLEFKNACLPQAGKFKKEKLIRLGE